MQVISVEQIIECLRELPDEKTREYEKKITALATKHQDEMSVNNFKEVMDRDIDVSYEAFYCLETIYRRNKDYSKLATLIEEARQHKGFAERISFKHICIMYNVHSESLYDYEEILEQAHQSACEMFNNSGYQHTFANAFATIVDKCLFEDSVKIIEKWYETALYCVNKAIDLDPKYAKFQSTKARIVSFKGRYDEANELLLRAIDLEDSRKADYALLIGNYQYYRTMIAIRRQNLGLKPASTVKNEEHNTDVLCDEGFINNKPYAFVSYSHTDREEVVKVIQKLRCQGYNVWYDNDIVPGQDWAEEIGKHLAGAQLFVLAISHSALLSGNVRNEITMAQNRKKTIIPVFLEEVYLSEGAELQLQRYHWIQKYDMSQEAFYNALFAALDKELAAFKGVASDAVVDKPKKESSVEKTKLEIFSMSKTGNEADNEDLVYIDEDFYAVFDGATSKTGDKWQGKTAGRITVELLAEGIKSKAFDREIDGKTAVSFLQSKLCAYSEKNDLIEKGVKLCASAVIYSKARRQIWLVGDCQYSINGEVYSKTKKIDHLFSEMRSMLIQALLAEGKTEAELSLRDEARSAMLELMKKQSVFENAEGEYGFPAFSGRGTVKQVKIVNVPLGADVVLASDGYPVLKSTLDESEDKLNELINNDPLCYKEFRSTKGLKKEHKSFDDRSFLRFVAE